jgi:HEPN domain-containing protein
VSAIDKVQNKIRKLYSASGHQTLDVPLPIRALVYAHFARHYLEAARVLDTSGNPPVLLMPWYQLIGQALELAMKSCLAVDGVDPPHTHDLISLCKRVEERGFVLGVEHIHALLVHLNHGYFEDLATGDRFVARYGGGGSWAVPDHARLAAACTSLIAQAEEQNPILRESPSEPVNRTSVS